ncbi:MAG TPA: hypothetical protein VK897_10535 [Anaerolineales bacterium]|nr:hypothetical protein [Anaerolineales bacterium]
MKHKSALYTTLTLTGLVAMTLGAYAFARFFLLPNFANSSPVFSTTYDLAATSMPLPVAERKIAATLPGRIHSFAVSPDGKTLAIATSKGAALYDLALYEQLRTLNNQENTFAVAFSPDGKKLALGSLTLQNSEAGIPHLIVWDTSNWKVLFEPRIGNGDTTMSFGALAWSTDGKLLATSDYDRGLVTFDVATGKTISFQKDFLLSPYDISWSPDGSRVVATGDLGYGFRRWRVDNDKSVRLYDQRVDAAMQIAWSPDGKRIASAHGNGAVCFWTVKTNLCDGMIQADDIFISSLAWSPDGGQLATGGDTIRVWNTQTGELLTAFGEQAGPMYSQLEWLANGMLVSLETGYVDRQLTVIRFWDMDIGEILLEFQGARGVFRK